MNKETMKQGMIRVLDTYSIPWGNSAIDKNLISGQTTRHL